MITLSEVTKESNANTIRSCQSRLTTLLNRSDLGFFRLLEREPLFSSSQFRASQIRNHYKKTVVLGIGGSSLGGRAIRDALHFSYSSDLHFFENVDSLIFWSKLQELERSILGDFSKVHWLIISKSGNTVETLTQATFLIEYLNEKNFSFSSNCTVISDSGRNPLTNWADENKVPRLEVPGDVGGRFSVLTPVGLLPAALMGADLTKIKEGMSWALKQSSLVAQLAAQTIESFERSEWITNFWSYSDRLTTFGLWIEQLWAESLAKKIDRSGKEAPRVSTPISLTGANDQHSVLQQIMEGKRDKFIWFLRDDETEKFGPRMRKQVFEGQSFLLDKTMGQLLSAEADATRMALQSSGVQSLTLRVKDLSPETLAALFMIFELTVGVIGEVLNINAYDQPGVELGKIKAKEILNFAR
jgi:glucose-6-phosphate isomerase